MKVNKFKLGVFVIGTLFLFMAMLIALGLSDHFKPKGHLVTYVSESVQGLEVGSAVKYKGVPVGRVSAIYIETYNKNIRIDMDINLEAFSVSPDSQMNMTINDFYVFCENERALGLRCRLDYSGLTGLKYIELDYFTTPNSDFEWRIIADRFYMPVTPSTLNDIIGKLTLAMDNIAEMDFQNMSNQLTSALQGVSDLVNNEDIMNSISKVSSAANNLDKISAALADSLTEESVEELMAELHSMVKEVNRLSQQVSEQVENSKFSDTTSSIRGGVASFEKLQRELSNTIVKLNATLDSAGELADSISEDPNSLVFGKNVKPTKVE